MDTYDETLKGLWNHLQDDLGTEADSGKVLGKYRIIREIARGGMGIVLEARDPDLKRNVALKILKEDDEVQIERLHREAELAGRLSHPNIISVHEIGSEESIHFITMDLVEGGTLCQL